MMPLASLLSALSFSVYLSLRILIIGLAWRWLITDNGKEQKHWVQSVFEANRVLLCGLPLVILITLSLGLLGIYTLMFDLIATLLVAGLGAILGRREATAGPLTNTGLVIIPILLFTGMLFPHPSQWVAGGWDPGVYMNTGMHLESSGNFHPADTVFQQELNEKEQSVFLRQFGNRTERFPGILMDYERDTMRFELHRLTPAAIATFIRSGGPAAAFQYNRILALFCLLSLFSLLLKYTSSLHALLATLFMAIHPILIYHANIPVSEILQLWLILGMGHLFLHDETNRGRTLLLSILLGCAVLNRFSFLPFAGLMLCALAYKDLERDTRLQVALEHLFFQLACIGGALTNLLIAWDSIIGWTAAGLIVKVTVLSFMTVWGIHLLYYFPPLRSVLLHQLRWLGYVIAPIALLALAWFWNQGRTNPTAHDLDNVYKVIQFSGGVFTVFALLGGLLLIYLPRLRLSRSFVCFLLFLTGITLLMLIKKNIIDIYPWALRRYLPYLVPLMAVSAAIPAMYVWQHQRLNPLMRKAACLLLIALPLGFSIRQSHAALTHIEYQQFADMIHEVAKQIDEQDIVVADSPTWGTPLQLVEGKNVFNGKRLWELNNPYKLEQGLEVLTRLHQQGYRIRFLTTTPEGLDWYPGPITPATLDWTSPTYTYETIAHHKKITRITTKPQTKTIRLFTWTPPPPNERQ